MTDTYTPTSWHSYPSIFALGHKAVASLLAYEDLLVEEKVDGSQFSFGSFGGELKLKSKNMEMHPEAPAKMFSHAAKTVQELAPILVDGWTYRAEYLGSPKHNSLTYKRVPEKNLIVFDINSGHDDYLSREDKEKEAARLGLEVVPLFYRGRVTVDMVKDFLDRESILGGPKVEGVVLKPARYDLYGVDKKVLVGKFVSEAFKEIHRATWGAENPNRKDILELIVDRLRTTARWEKAVQFLKESDQFTNSPKDIGLLMPAVMQDLEKEVTDDVKTWLFNHFWKDIQRGATRGLPEWYKAKLTAELLGEAVE